MVGNEGFEPPMPDSESGALPLGEFPTAQVSVANFGFLQVFTKHGLSRVHVLYFDGKFIAG